MDNSIQGIRSDIQGLNAYIQEILLYIRKDGCSCQCGNSKQQNITDVVILHAEDDRLLALDFMNNMEAEFPELKLNLKIFEQLNVGKSMFESASLLFETCRFLFVLLTHKFARDDLPRFLNEIALVETITFKDRNCRLIQVLIDGDCRAPELGPIIPLMYNRYLEAKSRGIRDRGFINSFEKLVKNGRKNYLTS
ncbi:uncharacterized protein LOC134695848 [Mytilus trossulus]|uniref:uncharacterized protein LOC134695848 n=1 Tax=Mytilus trossulus TaxID=6551 RepID=UPI003003F36D